MNSTVKAALIDAALAILALPILLVRAAIRARKLVDRVDAARRGVLRCRYCASPVPLSRMATCPVCGWTEANTMLHCGRCKTTFSAVRCDSCGGTNAL